LEEVALMFFVLSKTAALLLLPSNFLMLLGLVGVALMLTRRKRLGACMAAASLMLLAAVGVLPVGDLLARALEDRFPAWDASRGAPDGVVVLGGAIATELSRDHGEPVIGDSGARIVALARLAHDYPNARIVYSGGDASLFGTESPEANFVGPLLDKFGIARARVLLESRSRNTAENAAYTRNLIVPKSGERWLLVTSAQHMPRAVGCFRKVAFPVEAYPVGWRTKRGLELMPERTIAGGLARVDAAASEWIGLVAYRLAGKTSELFPSP
jgi:uncharacterized SAM-binding protein YcdF (DUF218 family)